MSRLRAGILLSSVFIVLIGFANCGPSNLQSNLGSDVEVSPKPPVQPPGDNNVPTNLPQLGVTTFQSFVVNNNLNEGPGSLRDAINQANSSSLMGRQIVFNLPDGMRTICPQTPLPALTGNIRLLGSSQPGFQGRPLISLSGECSSVPYGLVLQNESNEIESINIRQFRIDGIQIQGGGKNRIVGNYIGVDLSGTVARPNLRHGILITGSKQNIIGDPIPGGRNVISGNSTTGIVLLAGSDNNIIQNNFLGTDVNGARAIGNGFNGIYIDQSAGNLIGGNGAQFRNIISGNANYGITVAGPNSRLNQIQGNYIGLDVSGEFAIANMRTGVNLHNSAQNTVGGSQAGQRNVISGNARHGVNSDGAPPTADTAEPHYGHKGYNRENRIIGNYIGTNKTGTRAIRNGLNGVLLYHSHYNIVGGLAAGEGNLISGNGTEGINVTGLSETAQADNYDGLPFSFFNNSVGHQIFGNKIGTDVTGNRAIPNRRNGVFINWGRNIVVGNNQADRRNIIKFNSLYGVEIKGRGSETHQIGQANLINFNESGDSRVLP